ncbi:MAG: helix-turn-helix domain-containing protein [Micromonosporaceae bacterium]
MTDQFEKAAERAIAAMREDLGAPLTVDDLARAAMFSKFHFTRIFQRVTGVSPGRFLSALRLQQAKVLLVTTSLNVADISVRVGYNSVGTFSSRFTRSVGLSPTAYRRLRGVADQVAVEGPDGRPAPADAVVAGVVANTTERDPGRVFLGLFPGRIPEGRPVAWTVQSGPGPFVLDKVPAGEWYLLVQGIVADDPGSVHDGVNGLLVGNRGPITVGEHAVVEALDVQLRPVRFLDPPVLLALPT